MSIIKKYNLIKKALFLIKKGSNAEKLPSLFKLIWNVLIINKWDLVYKVQNTPYLYSSAFIAIIIKDNIEKAAIVNHYNIVIEDITRLESELSVLLNAMYMAAIKNNLNHLVFLTENKSLDNRTDFHSFILKNNFKYSLCLNALLQSKYLLQGSYYTRSIENI
jgi:hypothetical protein